jgi:hypothetical protein
MGLLVFKASEVKRIVEHAINAPDHTAPWFGTDDNGNNIYAEKKPCVVLVNGEGIYMMSNGLSRDNVSVAYAKGCNPQIDADWWDTSHLLVGGDDFVKYLPWTSEIKTNIDKGATQIILGFKENGIELSFK